MLCCFDAGTKWRVSEQPTTIIILQLLLNEKSFPRADNLLVPTDISLIREECIDDCDEGKLILLFVFSVGE